MPHPLKGRNVNSESFFDVAHLNSNLRVRTLNSSKITLIAQLVKALAQIGFIAILSRLLDPSDFGLVAMITIVTSLGMTLLDGGLSMATVHRESITHAQVSNLFWVNVLIGLTLALISIAISPIVSWLFDEPKILFPMIALSLSFLIGGFVVQHEAILKRQMRFAALSGIDLSSMIIGNFAGVVTAIYGFGFWALIISTIITFFSRVIFAWSVVGWVPSWFKRNSDANPLLRFGANLTGANFVGFFTNNVVPFSIGILGGAALLGLYDRAFRLASIPKNQVLMPVMKVLQSTLVRVANDQGRLRALALSLMAKLSIATFLITLIMYLAADWIILLLLGSSWKAAVPYFELLAVATIATPITTLTAMTLVAVGEANALFKWKIITFILLLVAIAIGANWGVLGILWGATLSAVFVRTPLFFIYAERHLPVDAKAFAGVITIPMVAALSVASLVKYLSIYYEPSELYSAFIIYCLIVPTFYIALCYCFKSTRQELNGIVGLVKDNFKISKKIIK